MQLPFHRHRNIAAFVPLVQFVNFLVLLLAIAVYASASSACSPVSEALRSFAYRRPIAFCSGGILFNAAIAVAILTLPNLLAFFGIAQRSPAIISRLGPILNTLVLIPAVAFAVTATAGAVANGDTILGRDALLLGLVIFIYLPNTLLLRNRLLRGQGNAKSSRRFLELREQMPLDAAPSTPPILGLTTEGRISRLRYVAYMLPAMFLQAFVYVVAKLFGSEHPVFMVIFVWPLLALHAWIAIRPIVLRLHDLNRNGKWAIAMFVLAALSVTAKSSAAATLFACLLLLYLLAFASVIGTAGSNDYGHSGSPQK